MLAAGQPSLIPKLRIHGKIYGIPYFGDLFIRYYLRVPYFRKLLYSPEVQASGSSKQSCLGSLRVEEVGGIKT